LKYSIIIFLNGYIDFLYIIMSEVLSVRVNKELKKKAKELRINIREVVEKALENAIREKEKEEIKGIAMKIKELMKDVSEEDWVRTIKESRDER